MKYWCLLLILLILPTALAGEKALVKSGTYKPGEVFTVEKTLRIEVADVNNEHAATLVIDDERLKITGGDCVERSGYEICVSAVVQSGEKHPRFDVYLYNYAIDVYRDISRVTVTQAPEVDKMTKGDRFKVVVTFENHGEKRAEDITWSQTIIGFIAYDTKDGCFFTENKVGWSGSLFPDRTASCTYYLEATSPGKHELPGVLQWTDDSLKTIETKLKLEVAAYDLIFTPTLAKKTITLGETTDLTLTYKNILTKDDIDEIETTIPFQPGITIVPAEPTFQKPHELRWDDFLRLSEEKQVIIKVTGDTYGYFTIPIDIVFRTKGNEQTFTEHVTLEVKAPSVSVAVKPESMESGEEAALKVTAHNPQGTALTDVNLIVQSDLFDIPVSFEKALWNAGESITLYEGTAKTKHSDVEQKIPVKVTGTAVFEGQTINLNEEQAVTIIPKKDVMIAPVEEVPINTTNETVENRTLPVESEEVTKEEYMSSKKKQLAIGVAAILLIIAGFIGLQYWQKYKQQQKIERGMRHRHDPLQPKEEHQRHSRKQIADEVEKLTKK